MSCIDTPHETPGYKCGKCPVGLEGDGMNCTEIDEVTSHVTISRILGGIASWNKTDGT